MKKLLLLMILMCFALSETWSQTGDGCVNAVPLTPGTQQCGNSAGLLGDFPGSGTAPTNPCHSSYNDDEYWYSFTPGSSGMILDLTLSSISMTWAGLFVLDSCAGGSTACVGFGRNTSSTTDISVMTSVLTMGQTYYIVIANWGTPNNTAFCLDAAFVAPPTPPVNDLCSGASPSTVYDGSCSGVTTTGTNVAATDSGEGAPCGFGTYSGGDVWYEFTMPASVPDSTLVLELIQTVGSLYGEIYQASTANCGSLPTATYCSNFLSTSTNEIVTSMAPSTTYLLRLFESSNDASGTFEFCLRTLPPPPVNDSCSTATVVVVDEGECRTTITGTNESATDSGEGAVCGGGPYSGGDIWYKLTMPAGSGDSTLVIDMITTVGSMYGELYPDGTCGSLPAAVYCSNFLSTSANEVITGLTPGATYLLRMFEGGNNSFGSFDFCLRTPPLPPTNDLCAGAITVSVGLDSCSGPTTVSTTESATDSGEGAPCGAGTYAGGDVWFEFTLPVGASQARLDLISTTGSLYGEVYEASTADCGALPAAVYCSNFLSTGTEEKITGLTGGSTYLLRIFESGNNPVGPFEFCMYTGLASPNDECTNATAIACTDSLAGATTQFDTDNGDDVGCTQGIGVWYVFSDPSGGTATVTVTPAVGYDHEIGVATSPDCVTFTNVGCADDFGSGTAEEIEFAYSPGVNYYIYVGHFSNTSTTVGEFGIKVSCVACVVPTFAVQVDPTNCPTSMALNVVVSDIGSAPTGVDIWDSKNMSVSHTNVGVGTYALTGFALGDTVDVAVYDNADPGCTDTFSLILPAGCPPPNDLCSGAIAVPVDSAACTSPTTMGTNTNATDSGEGEPCGFGDYQGGDVWYSFTQPVGSTSIRIDLITTVGSLYGELYEMAPCGSLSPAVYCSDFLSTGTEENITGLTGGASYLLRLFESGNNTFGTFEFCLNTPPPPPDNDECAMPGILLESADPSCANGVSGTTNFATASAEDDCNNTTNKDVWYSFVPSSTASYEVQVAETFDYGFSSTYVSVFTGACGAITQVGTSCFSSALTLNLTASTTYLINVRSTSSTAGVDFDLCAFPTPPPPPNDSCSMATIMMCGDSLAGTTISATGSSSSSCLGSQGNNVWYRFVGTGLETSIIVDADVSGGFQAQIDLYKSTDGSCATISCIGGEGTGGNPVELLFTAELDTVYYISIGEWISSGPEGNFGIEITCIECSAPTGLAASNPTTTTIDMTWDSVPESIGYILEYDTTGFTVGSGTRITSSSMGGPETLTGLMASTTYDVYIYNLCMTGDTSDAAGPASGGTLCGTQMADYTQDFELFPDGNLDGAIFDCWQNVRSAEPEWKGEATTTTSSNTGPSGPYEGSRYIFLETSTGAAGMTDTITGPVVDISALSSPQLSFWYHMYGSTMGTLHYEASYDGGATWSSLGMIVGQQQTASADPWLEQIASLAGTTVVIRFVGETGGTFTSDMAVDLVVISEGPACSAPSNLMTANVTSDGTDVSWTENGTATAWEVEIVAGGAGQGTGTIYPVSGSPSTMITGLMSATDYDTYVRAVCGPGDSSTWVGPASFMTLCETFVPYYLEAFETFLPTCWSATDNATPDWAQDDFGNVVGGPNLKAAKINIYASQADTLFSPAFDLSGGTYNLSFDFASTAWNGTAVGTWGAGDYIDLLVSEDDGATWSLIMTWNNTNKPSTTGDSLTFDLSAYSGNALFGFAAVGVNAGSEDIDVFVDNFEVKEAPIAPCPPTLNVTGTTVTGTYRAVNITSDAVINSPEVVNFEAGNSVSITTPFEVKLGAEFTVKTVVCP